ncbi:hypothetical protein ABZS86_05455 [Streptomyces sp. NPDC005355]
MLEDHRERLGTTHLNLDDTVIRTDRVAAAAPTARTCAVSPVQT